jgi:hypothetical protein
MVLDVGSVRLTTIFSVLMYVALGSILSGCTDGLMYTVEGPIITGASRNKH